MIIFLLRVADASIATNSRFDRRILREPRKYKKILFLSYCISNSHSIWCFQLLRSTSLSLHIFDKLSLATGEQPQIFVVILTKTTGDSRLRRLGCFLRAFPKGGAQMCFFPERPTRLLIKFLDLSWRRIPISRPIRRGALSFRVKPFFFFYQY